MNGFGVATTLARMEGFGWLLGLLMWMTLNLWAKYDVSGQSKWPDTCCEGKSEGRSCYIII